ncbi:MAG: iron hydrogenase small subunit [Lachnospiraceae bacterium]|nr:iron hydrogenase small subunit [Lachnospiraceae bacterium]
MVKLVIDGKNIQVKEGTSILEAAKINGINIPTLCFLKDLNEIAACRVCVVEVEGIEKCVTACNNKVQEGMVIHTNSKKAREARKLNLELILSQHNFTCATCIRNGICKLQELTKEFGITDTPYNIKYEQKKWDNSIPLIRDFTKCIKCMRCVQVCEKVQSLGVWDIVNTGGKTTVNVRSNKKLTDVNCSYCGQCIVNCPVGALHERDDVKVVLDALDNKDKITIVQVAPAVRAAYGEGIGLKREEATEKKLAGILKSIGFDHVFDTVFSADMTIMEEGSEFLTRLDDIRKTGLPMFTSCCPGWLRFIKSEFPDLVGRLSSAKSPQGMFGALAKSYYAEILGVPEEKIFSVSIMPCLAKKDEETLDNNHDIDAVLTTRELDRLLVSTMVNPKDIPETEFDSPLGVGTGAGVIFGVTGGVMEAALRSAYFLVNKKNPDADAFKDVRGLDGYKEASFDFGNGVVVKVAVVHSLSNARKLINKVLKGEVKYDFVEVMACPGGCINGGGQIINLEGSDLAARSNVLYGLDKVNNLRFSHENPEVIECYKKYLKEPLSEKAHHLLHRDHIKEMKEQKALGKQV